MPFAVFDVFLCFLFLFFIVSLVVSTAILGQRRAGSERVS